MLNQCMFSPDSNGTFSVSQKLYRRNNGNKIMSFGRRIIGVLRLALCNLAPCDRKKDQSKDKDFNNFIYHKRIIINNIMTHY